MEIEEKNIEFVQAVKKHIEQKIFKPVVLKGDMGYKLFILDLNIIMSRALKQAMSEYNRRGNTICNTFEVLLSVFTDQSLNRTELNIYNVAGIEVWETSSNGVDVIAIPFVPGKRNTPALILVDEIITTYTKYVDRKTEPNDEEIAFLQGLYNRLFVYVNVSTLSTEFVVDNCNVNKYLN